jgi:CBS domain-containing protein/ribosome-associated translation inhibitor RaiA
MPTDWPLAGDMMTARPITLTRDSPLSQALGIMRARHIHEIPVVQNRQFVGMVTFDAIARRINLPLTTKLEHLMLLPPIVGTDTTYPELSEQLLATGMRAAPVTGPRNQLLGVVSRTDLVRALPKIPVLAEHPIDEVMAPLNLILQERDPVRILLGQDALRHLETHPIPVIDRKGDLTGAVGIADLGEVLWRPTAQGHRDVSNRGNVSEIEVRTIMHSPAVTAARGTSTGAAARLMSQQRVSSVFIVDGGRPTGIVSQADLIGLAVGGTTVGGGSLGDFFVQIQGLRASGDPAILADIDHVIARGLRRIARYAHPVMLNVHFQPHASHRSGEASVQGRLTTDHETLYASRTGWNFYSALNDLLDELESQARRHKEERPHGIHRPATRLVVEELGEPSADPDLEARIRSATHGDRRRRRRQDRRGGGNRP